MRDKVTQVREYILERILSGEYDGTRNLPAARTLCAPTGASFAIVQRALNTLEDDGVLRCMLRNGTRLNENWPNALVRNSVVCFTHDHPFLSRMREALERSLPKLHLISGFERGMFEIRTTMHVQQHMDEYLDLSGFLAEEDLPEFFRKPFDSFRQADGRMFGIPFIFSPRVMFFNPAVLETHGVPLPENGWTWSDFMATIRTLRGSMAPDAVFNYISEPYLWMNFVFRCGGSLLHPGPMAKVMIDAPETVTALEHMRELRREMALEMPLNERKYRIGFARGEHAFLLGPREDVCCFDENGLQTWRAISLPAMPGGKATTAMAADLICIRRECTDLETARDFVRFMLSEETQDAMAGLHYGIPVRRASAFRSLNVEDPRDVLFLSEMNTMTAEYNLNSAALNKLVCDGINRIIDGDCDLREAAVELANAVRTFLAISGS